MACDKDERWAAYNARGELLRVEDSLARKEQVEAYYHGLGNVTVRRVRIVPVGSEEAK